jgi:hypothetical protein
MQVVTNQRLVRRETRIGVVLLGLTFFLLGMGILLSWNMERWLQQAQPEESGPELIEPWLAALTYGVVIVGMTLYFFGNMRVRRYGVQHRQDGRLVQFLKGLDDRYVLYAFLGRRLPDYVLCGPSGVHVLTTRPQQGEIVCRDDRWSRRSGPAGRILGVLFSNPIGSPSYDASRGVQRMRELLNQKLPGLADQTHVDALIVFTGSRVRLRIERSSFPATTGKELRRVVGKFDRRRLKGTQLAEVRAALESQVSG